MESVNPLLPSRPVTNSLERRTLDQLRLGERARVLRLAARGPERRRLMDIGFVPGAPVEVEMENPLGDPRAFRVMGGVVAVRVEQARLIEILPEPGAGGGAR